MHVVKMVSAYSKEGLGICLMSPGLKQTTKEQLCRYYAVGMDESWTWRKFPIPGLPGSRALFYLRLKRALRRLQPDIVHARSIVGALAAAAERIPFLVEIHLLPSSLKLSDRVALRHLLSHVSCLGMVVITKKLRSAYKEWLNSEHGFILAPDGADLYTPHVLPFDGLAGRPSNPNALYCGSFLPGKGVELVVQLAIRCPDWDFHVVGGNKEEIKQVKNQRAHNLFFYGRKSHAETSHFLDASDVLLLPNQAKVFLTGKAEDIGSVTSPLKLFEYMSHGKAIIASDLPVLREVLDETCAVLVPPDSAEAWEEALESMRDPSNRQRLGQNALQVFRGSYTWQNRASIIIKSCGLCKG